MSACSNEGDTISEASRVKGSMYCVDPSVLISPQKFMKVLRKKKNARLYTERKNRSKKRQIKQRSSLGQVHPVCNGNFDFLRWPYIFVEARSSSCSFLRVIMHRERKVHLRFILGLRLCLMFGMVE